MSKSHHQHRHHQLKRQNENDTSSSSFFPFLRRHSSSTASQLLWKKLLASTTSSSSFSSHDIGCDDAGPSSSSPSTSSVESSFQTGVTFDRNITQFPNDGATLTLNFYRNKTIPPPPPPPPQQQQLKCHEYDNVNDDSYNHDHDSNENELEDVCTTHDTYGDNVCHYNWDDFVTIKYSIESKNVTFTKHDYVVGNFTIDNRLPYTFTCNVCGEDCILKVPIIEFEYALPMPDCPVKPKKRSHTLLYQLWKTSPTHGFVTTSINGIVTIMKSTKTTTTETSTTTTTTAAGNKFHNVTIAQINIQVNVR